MQNVATQPRNKSCQFYQSMACIGICIDCQKYCSDSRIFTRVFNTAHENKQWGHTLCRRSCMAGQRSCEWVPKASDQSGGSLVVQLEECSTTVSAGGRWRAPGRAEPHAPSADCTGHVIPAHIGHNARVKLTATAGTKTGQNCQNFHASLCLLKTETAT